MAGAVHANTAIVSAGGVLRGVCGRGAGGVRVHARCDDVAAPAALVAERGGAVDQLLLAETPQRTRRDLVRPCRQARARRVFTAKAHAVGLQRPPWKGARGAPPTPRAAHHCRGLAVR